MNSFDLSDPTTTIWIALLCPFMARFFVAWTVWLRLRGLAPGAKIGPKPQRSDYATPRYPVVEAAVLVLIAVVAGAIATIVGSLVSRAGFPSWIWPGICLGALIPSLVYAWRRVREDDRRERRRLAEWLISESSTRQG